MRGANQEGERERNEEEEGWFFNWDSGHVTM